MPELWERDTDFPACLIGRFPGLLVDHIDGTSTLFNDRYGLHRCSIMAKDAFYFSRAEALLAIHSALRRSEPRALGEYITCGCVLENRTMFDRTHVLPGAAKWTIRNGSVEKKNPTSRLTEWEEQKVLDPGKYYQGDPDVLCLESAPVFSVGATDWVVADRRIGYANDLAWRQALPGSLPSYTFGGTYRDCQDVIVARQVARASSSHIKCLKWECLSLSISALRRAYGLPDGRMRRCTSRF